MNKITIRFDGGCRPSNPGNKYGSFEVSLNGRQIILVSRQEFGFGTNNEAEWNSFEAALKWTVRELQKAGNYPKQFSLQAFSDSMVVVNRMLRITTGGKKEAQRRMAFLAGKCLQLTHQFKSFHITWNGRESNVRKFGH
jgi:ribonuclease HI